MAQKKKKINDLISDLKTQIDEDSSKSAIESQDNSESDNNSEAMADPSAKDAISAFIEDLENIPSDNDYLLNSIENIEAIARSLYNLILIVGDHSLNPEALLNILSNYREAIERSKNNVVTEGLLNLAKKQFLYSIKSLVTRLNKLIIKSEMSFDDLGLAMADLISGKEYEIREEIPSNDIKEILESISLIFPEVKLPKLTSNLKIAQKIFTESNLTTNNSSMVMDTMFSLMIGKGLNIFQIGEKLCKGSKSFTNGNIDVIFRDIEYDLVAQYGEDTYQVFSILLAYWYKNKPKNWGETITLSGDDILEILKEKNKIIRDKEDVKRLSKIEGLKWVAHHCELLKGIRVYSSQIIPSGKGKKSFSIEETPLIEFSKIRYYPVNIKDNNYPLFENIKDLHISFKVGEWFKFFDDEKYLKQYGYTHREAFSHSGLVSALLHWLNNKLEQNQRGEFKLKTIIDQIGLKAKLEAIYSEADSKKASDLKRDLLRVLMSALTEIKEEIEDPYQWEFKNAPQWLTDNSKKPRGWFNTWLDVVIVFKHPQILIAEGKEYRREKIKEVTPEAKPNKLTANDLKSALNQYSDNKNVSLRKLAEAYGTSHPTLSRKLKSGNFTQFELRDLIKWVHILGKNKK